MTHRGRMLVGFALANVAILAIAAALHVTREPPPPVFQGVLLDQGRSLAPFSLLDHNGDPFTNSDLQGRWHLVSYGFTTCPDVCPTTLSTLSTLATRLGERGRDDLKVLFYSVDHRRDTVHQMAAYVPFFHPDFLGLTHLDDPDNPHLPFERDLGITARLVPDTESTDPDDYQVLHGVNLLLLNPAGELQAIFKPRESAPGIHVFDPEVLLSDYLALRRYLES